MSPSAVTEVDAPRAGAPAPRHLSLVDCIGIGINGIVGSGVYLLIAPLAQVAGPASIAGIFVCGVTCILISLCFAELTGMFDRSGGAYVYAKHAFGRIPGFAVGWMSLSTGVLAFAAVASGFAEALAKLWPTLSGPLVGAFGSTVRVESLVAVALICALGVVNYWGVRAGAKTSTVLSFLKLFPILLVVVVGLFSLDAAVLEGVFRAPSGKTYAGALASSAFLAVFMLSGFEYTAVPAGEAKDARRNVPIAIVGSLLGAALLYCLVQIVALSVLPDLSGRAQPLIDVAEALLGPFGKALLGAAAVVSMAAFCAGSALVGPRYFTAMADDGYLPKALSRASARKTPGLAIAASTLISAALSLQMGYASLVDVSNVALFAQFIPASVAVAVLRYTMPDAPRRYRLPLGPTIPIAATLASVGLLILARPKASEWRLSGLLLLYGAAIWTATLVARKIRR